MTDHEKLEEIKKMCEEAFSSSFSSDNVDLGRAQALANVYGVILYDGANIINTAEAVQKFEDEKQMSFDDLLGNNAIGDLEPDTERFLKMLKDCHVTYYSDDAQVNKLSRTPVTFGMLAQLKHKADVASILNVSKEDFVTYIQMSHEDLSDIMHLLHENKDLARDSLGEIELFGLPVILDSNASTISVIIESQIRAEGW